MASRTVAFEKGSGKPRTLGYKLTQEGWGGTLCPGCTTKSERRGETYDTKEPIHKKDEESVDVCEDCGKTIQKGKAVD